MPKSLQQLMEENIEEFREKFFAHYASGTYELGSAITGKQIESFLLSSLQSAHELGKAEAMESVRKKIASLKRWDCYDDGGMDEGEDGTYIRLDDLLTSLTPSSDITKE